MRETSGAIIVLALACAPGGPRTRDGTDPPVAGPALAYVNGAWWTGDRFVRQPMYSVAGTFVERPPATVDTTLDLEGGFVVPPFGDAHTHNLDGPANLDAIRARYVGEGTFYVQVLTNTASRAAAVRSRFNRPCELDVVYANGGLTATLSHPFLAYEPRAMSLIRPGEPWEPHADAIRRSRIRLGDAYWFIDSLPDLDALWPAVIAARPDLVKIFLLDATEDPPAGPDTGLPARRGLRPSLVRPIVRRAHAAGLRVAAHIETAPDARLAIENGVDLLAHLPGYLMSHPDSVHRYELDSATIRLAAARGVVATPTLVWASSGETSAPLTRARLALQRRNLARLRDAGAVIVVGSDQFGSTASVEFAQFAALDLWSNAELLSIWSTATPRSIFPGRRIGVLAPGYEASFLVLPADPTRSLDALRDVRLRVKQGCVITD